MNTGFMKTFHLVTIGCCLHKIFPRELMRFSCSMIRACRSPLRWFRSAMVLMDVQDLHKGCEINSLDVSLIHVCVSSFLDYTFFYVNN